MQKMNNYIENGSQCKVYHFLREYSFEDKNFKVIVRILGEAELFLIYNFLVSDRFSAFDDYNLDEKKFVLGIKCRL